MPDILDKLKQYGGLLGKGLMTQLAPGIAEGLINELFHQWKIDRAKAIQDVQSNRSLWNEMAPDERKELNSLAVTIGNLDFITPIFIINSIKKDFPSVASLFLNWPEAQEWLARQIEDLKKEASSDAEP
jgi:hypothetical protein